MTPAKKNKPVPRTAPGLPKSYSGPASAAFWDRVNSLPGARNSAAYALGVALQNLEDDVLRQILIFEEEVRRGK